jgi:disulfide bond formation protein DsbB
MTPKNTLFGRLWFGALALSPRQVAAVCVAFAVALTVAAFVLEYGFDALPCQMCWWQRYLHWALGGVALVGVLWARAARWALGGVALTALGGLGVGVYQLLVQAKIVPAPAGCGSPGLELATDINAFMASLNAPVMAPPCDVVGFTIFGLSLAAWNVAAMLGVLAALAVYFKKGAFHG